MAEELSIEPDEFIVDVQWPSAPEAGGNALLDASIARFEMKAGEAALTAHQTDSGVKNSYLTVPAYYLVEWLAQNWWAFLYEPRKLDRSEAETEFRSRHWLGIPRNGFALPDVMFAPSGETVEVTARGSYLRFAQVNFTETVSSIVRTDQVRSELTKFIDQVLGRMTEKGIKKSEAHDVWAKIINTSADEEPYCRLLGAMGLSPYVTHPEIDAALEGISDSVSSSILMDLCDATNLASFPRAAEFTERIAAALNESSNIEIAPLLKAAKPEDNFRQAYEWGYYAASKARDALGIAHDNPKGRSEFFEKLGYDPNSSVDIGSQVSTVFPIQGAVSRSGKQMKLALSSGTDKEFSAARASFLALVDNENASRLVTTSKTRQQRASRAFGAELLAPRKFITQRLGREKDVSPFTLDKISNEIEVASTIVRLQAQNNGYRIMEAA